jgi:hypothetical protein
MEKATMPFEDARLGLETLRAFIEARRAGVPLPT